MLTEKERCRLAENAQEALQMLDSLVVDLSEQERQIENIVFDFLYTKDGKCCLLEGARRCGRESTLRKVLKKYEKELRVVDAGHVAADPAYQLDLAKEDDVGCSVFLVRDADKLLTPQHQKSLYTMVDKATHFSWLVFFSVSQQGFTQRLQKQATSRIPKLQVSFYATHDFEVFCSAMNQFLMPNGSKAAENETYRDLVSSLAKDYQLWLKPIFYTSSNPYVAIKQLAAQILMFFGYMCTEESDWNSNEIGIQIRNIMDCYLPEYHKLLLLLKDQTVQAQSVFLCVWKLLQKKEALGPEVASMSSYRSVFTEYKKLVNHYFPSLDVRSDVYIFRVLDHLVELGLLKVDQSTSVTNASFRKVWLNVNEKEVEDLIPKLRLPSQIHDFFIEIAK